MVPFDDDDVCVCRRRLILDGGTNGGGCRKSRRLRIMPGGVGACLPMNDR